MNQVTLHLVESCGELDAMRRWLGERRQFLAVDTETGGLEWWRQPLRMVQLGDMYNGWAVPHELWRGALLDLLPRYDRPVIMHNAKFDLHFLESAGIRLFPNPVDDTKLAAHVLEPHRSQSLKPLANRLVDGASSAALGNLKSLMRSRGWDWATIPYDCPEYWRYAALDAVLTARVADVLFTRLQGASLDVYHLEREAQEVLRHAEMRGVRIDLRYCHSRSDEYGDRIQGLVEAAPVTKDGETVLSRPEELVDALLVDDVRLEKRTPTGAYSVDEDVLSKIDHPLARQALEYRRLVKWRGAYFRSFLERADGDILHPSIHTTGARTGRMSVTEPALQTIPRGPEVRDAFIASDRCRLLLADYSQMELRVLAHFAQDAAMIKAFLDGEDLHALTAQALGCSRTVAKNTNFSLIYVAGVRRYSETAGVPLELGEMYYRRWYEIYPGIKRLHQEIESAARTRLNSEGRAYVRSPLGREHPGDPDKLYTLTNYLVQGTCAEVLKQVIVELDNADLSQFLVLPIHDELMFDIPDAVVDDVRQEVIKVMTRHEFSVPLEVDTTVVERWGDRYR